MKPAWWHRTLPSFEYKGDSSSLRDRLTRHWNPTTRQLAGYTGAWDWQKETHWQMRLPGALPALEMTLTLEDLGNGNSSLHLGFPVNSTAVIILWGIVMMGWGITQAVTQPATLGGGLAVFALGAACYGAINLAFWRKAGKLLDQLASD